MILDPSGHPSGQVRRAMKACKCQAFHSIRDSLLSAMDLLCHGEMTPKAWSLLWFNYAQCHYRPYQCGWWGQMAHILPKERNPSYDSYPE